MTLDLREQIARIDRAIAANHKFTAEQQKLMAESRKFERWYPVIAGAGVMTAGGVLLAAGFALGKLFP